MKLIIVTITSILVVYSGYYLITAVIANNGSMFLIGGIIAIVAGIFCLIEAKLCR